MNTLLAPVRAAKSLVQTVLIILLLIGAGLFYPITCFLSNTHDGIVRLAPNPMPEGNSGRLLCECRMSVFYILIAEKSQSSRKVSFLFEMKYGHGIDDISTGNSFYPSTH